MEDIEIQGSLSKNSKILVCISGSPSNPKVIRIASRNALLAQCPLTALYVTAKDTSRNAMLEQNIDLAKSLGANFVSLHSDDVIIAIADYAKDNQITDLYIGMSGQDRQQTVSKRLTKLLPSIAIHIIPNELSDLTPSRIQDHRQLQRNLLADTLRMLLIMTVATIVSLFFYYSRFSNANIITIYILAVLITSITTSEKRQGVIAAILYILLFNYLFLEPRFTLRVYDPSYMVTYIVTIFAAFLTGTLSAQMKESTRNARENAYQARVLLNATKLLEKAETTDDVFKITVNQLIQLLGRNIILFHIQDGKLGEPLHYHVKEQVRIEPVSEKDREIIAWVYRNKTRAGAYTSRFPDSDYQYLAITTNDKIYGILGIDMHAREFSEVEQTILLSILGECSIHLENKHISNERERAMVFAENERFRANLLRSISHDLRTPLTSISGDAFNLMQGETQLSHDERKQIYTDIYDDSMWLINMVENLLSISKLKEGIHLTMTEEVVADVMQEALKHIDRHAAEHHLIKKFDHEFLMATMDTRLIMQVILNLVNNAIKYTEPGSTITLSDKREGNKIVITVEDDGPGVDPEELPHIFDAFYTGRHSVADASRSLGLGLSLSRSIVQAHGGTIEAYNRTPHGAGFRFTLQEKETES